MLTVNRLGAGVALSVVALALAAPAAHAETQYGWFCRFDAPVTASSTPKTPISLDLTDTGSNEAVKTSAQGQGAHFAHSATEMAYFYSLANKPTTAQCSQLLADVQAGKLPASLPDQQHPYTPAPATSTSTTKPTSTTTAPAGGDHLQPTHNPTSPATQPTAPHSLQPTYGPTESHGRGVPAKTGVEGDDLTAPAAIAALGTLAVGMVARRRNH